MLFSNTSAFPQLQAARSIDSTTRNSDGIPSSSTSDQSQYAKIRTALSPSPVIVTPLLPSPSSATSPLVTAEGQQVATPVPQMASAMPLPTSPAIAPIVTGVTTVAAAAQPASAAAVPAPTPDPKTGPAPSIPVGGQPASSPTVVSQPASTSPSSSPQTATTPSSDDVQPSKSAAPAGDLAKSREAALNAQRAFVQQSILDSIANPITSGAIALLRGKDGTSAGSNDADGLSAYRDDGGVMPTVSGGSAKSA